MEDERKTERPLRRGASAPVVFFTFIYELSALELLAFGFQFAYQRVIMFVEFVALQIPAARL